MARADDFVDKRGPVVWPFLLENGDEDQVELVEERLLRSQGFVGARALDNELYDEIANAWEGEC